MAEEIWDFDSGEYQSEITKAKKTKKNLNGSPAGTKKKSGAKQVEIKPHKVDHL